MKTNKYLFSLLLLCDITNAHDIKVSDCSYDQLIQQDRVYWCLMDKYQKSVLALKHEEDRAEKRLKQYDTEGLMKMALLITNLIFI